MAFSMTCDSCGTEIGPSDSARVTAPGDGTEAGAAIDLCLACYEPVDKVATMKRGKENFRKRRDAIAARTGPAS